MCGQSLMAIKFYYPVSSYNALYNHKNKLNHNAYVSDISISIFDIYDVTLLSEKYIFEAFYYNFIR